jgi:acetyl-CoA synthase
LMSRIVAAAAIRGAHAIVEECAAFIGRAVKEKGREAKVELPETAYSLPFLYALLGEEVKQVGDMPPILEYARGLLHEPPSESVWLPYLGPTLDAGIATLFAEEMIVALRYLYGMEPQHGCNGFFTDTIMRTLGIQLVDGRMPGFAAILGAAPDSKTAVKIVRELQKRSILVFAGSSSNGTSIIDQLVQENVQMGWEPYIVPYGRDTVSAIYPLDWAIRAALTFGGLRKGQARECLLYCKDRVFAFGLALGPLDDLKYATGAGAINMGFPVIADTDIPEIRPTGICTYEHLVKVLDYEKLVPAAIQVRGVKVKVQEVGIPVPYSPAFEGEVVRRESMHVQMGQKYSKAVEYLRMRELDQVEDGKTEIIGPDIDSVETGGAMPLAILVDVAGRRMQKDFEPILERRFHSYINQAMGISHIGQRNICWYRVSTEAFQKGFRLRDFGRILHFMLHEEYGKIVDKVGITILSREADVERVLMEAIPAFGDRDARVEGMTDESVGHFYSCTLCQSFAPNHLCIISPERLGLCGAYNWLDGKASHEINPRGPNQPVRKGECLDPVKGIFKGVNEAVKLYSHGHLEQFTIYSLMDTPMTSCGCFECIMAIMPEVNGVMIVNREYPEMTPCGMKFTTLAGAVGGGQQTPGFLGIGRLYITSRKFIVAEGGLKRIVWMPRMLKDDVRPRFEKRAKEEGVPDLLDKIADESVGSTVEEIAGFLQKTGHPVLSMPPLM